MPTLTYGTRTSTSIAITITAASGETTFDLEANRSIDFSADESIFLTGIAAGTTTVQDLVEQTPFFFRARKTNGGVGDWSAPLLIATLPGSARIPYSGFSVEPAVLVVPEPLTDMAASAAESGSVVDNLQNDDPMSTLRMTGPGSITFRTPGRPVDVFALLGTLANESVTWRIRGATSPGAVTSAPLVDTGAVSFRVAQGVGARKHYHGYRRLTQPYACEYWRIDIAGVSAFFLARHLVVGLARSSVNISRGQGSSAEDRGTMNRNLYGVPDRVVGWRGKRVSFPLSWIREAEYEAKWSDLEQLVGTTSPVLAIPNPKLHAALNDRIAYGTVREMESENLRGDRYSKTLTIDSLY